MCLLSVFKLFSEWVGALVWDRLQVDNGRDSHFFYKCKLTVSGSGRSCSWGGQVPRELFRLARLLRPEPAAVADQSILDPAFPDPPLLKTCLFTCVLGTVSLIHASWRISFFVSHTFVSVFVAQTLPTSFHAPGLISFLLSFHCLDAAQTPLICCTLSCVAQKARNWPCVSFLLDSVSSSLAHKQLYCLISPCCIVLSCMALCRALTHDMLRCTTRWRRERASLFRATAPVLCCLTVPQVGGCGAGGVG